MRPLDEAWVGLAARLEKAPAVVVGSDFDGTLVPLQDRPEAVALPASTRTVLKRLASARGVTLAIVSGRALEDVRKRTGVRGAILIGNHGYEIGLPGKPVRRRYGASDRKAVLRAAREAEAVVRDIPGVFFEDKGPIVTLHYRQAPPEKIMRIDAAAARVAGRFAGAVRVTEGKCVLEFRPPHAVDKGQALREALGAAGIPDDALLFYFGDDETDEDVFRALPEEAVTVHVGDVIDATAARYRASDPGDVVVALARIARLAGRRPAGRRPAFRVPAGAAGGGARRRPGPGGGT